MAARVRSPNQRPRKPGNPLLPGDPSNTSLAAPHARALWSSMPPRDLEWRGRRPHASRSVGVAIFLATDPAEWLPEIAWRPREQASCLPGPIRIRLAAAPRDRSRKGRKAPLDAIRRGHCFSGPRVAQASVEVQDGLAVDLAVTQRGNRGAQVPPAHLQAYLRFELAAAQERGQEAQVPAEGPDVGLVDEEALDAAHPARDEAAQADPCILAARPAVEDDHAGGSQRPQR